MSWEEYDVEGHSPRMDEFREEYARRSEALYADLPCRRDIAYGGSAREKLDFFPSASPADRVLVYWHGGFWRRGLKEHSAHLAGSFTRAGWNFATVEYPIVPDATFDDIVAATDRLMHGLSSILAEHGLRNPRLVLGGHSAGVLLAALGLARSDSALPVSGLILLSGLYDLVPLRSTPAQSWLGLTEDEAERFSPMRLPLWRPRAAVLIAVGRDDRPGFRQQSLAFHRRLQQAGHDTTLLMPAGECHFSIIGALDDPARPLGHAALHLLDPVHAL